MWAGRSSFNRTNCDWNFLRMPVKQLCALYLAVKAINSFLHCCHYPDNFAAQSANLDKDLSPLNTCSFITNCLLTFVSQEHISIHTYFPYWSWKGCSCREPGKWYHLAHLVCVCVVSPSYPTSPETCCIFNLTFLHSYIVRPVVHSS